MTTENQTSEQNNRPPHRILFIIDNRVEDMIYTQSRMAAILLSDPIIFDGTELEDTDVYVGYSFDPETNTFSAPSTEININTEE
jgi:hypothetical protein